MPDRQSRLRRTLGEQHWKFLDGALLSTIGTLYAHEFSSRALPIAVQMEGLGFRSWKMAAIQLAAGDSATFKTHLQRPSAVFVAHVTPL